ncbi:MAG: hypothetical protein ABH872_06415 [Candidatus Omnitrophota bacterium]
MRNKRFQALVAAAICLYCGSLFLCMPVSGENSDDYEDFLKKPSRYSSVVNYLRNENRKFSNFALTVKEAVYIYSFDLLLSTLCLWAALWLSRGTKKVLIKEFVWFLIAINLAWFVTLLFLKGLWAVLTYLVLKLRPDLKTAFVDNYYVAVVVFSVCLYVWLLARTFNLTFLGSLKTFLVSQAIYFVIVGFCFTFLPRDNYISKLSQNTVGLKYCIRQYVSDVNKIAYDSNVFSFFRVRFYHL